MPSPTDDETPFPALSHAATFSVFGRSHLSPQDAHLSPPRRARDFDGDGTSEMRRLGGYSERSRSRRRKRAWKKLMWVKQSWAVPDNYTDQATFLENLQRNPRLKPYDFWPLVADSTVILQHVCSVTIFIVCFVGIYHERVSPVSVVSWSSFATFVGWILWERWVSEEEDKEDEANAAAAASAAAEGSAAPAPVVRAGSRLGTIKSALLIWSTLLGLSPILRSLTESTSSDSIWAISFWLLAINIFFFDYSGGVGAKFPASLSTNAALMASTVLASRLPSTGQVFSLTLFSIEVFGLFPVFRRHIRHRSWRYHVLQTVVLVLGAGLGVGMVVGAGQGRRWPWKSGIVGMILSVVIAALATENGNSVLSGVIYSAGPAGHTFSRNTFRADTVFRWHPKTMNALRAPLDLTIASTAVGVQLPLATVSTVPSIRTLQPRYLLNHELFSRPFVEALHGFQSPERPQKPLCFIQQH
ncbi:Phosphatidylinositol N-acetylglucosaminyltransferase [Metarhizium robertsii ARSEF 23]|uniref:Phosphatidylinositol N-acetylglucosaminyltransferase n=1 Tax=Metarhizium robertsii (strain ARSEF 23 / ATCC MYA-3075) TaxID=655844 RepID=E9ENB7_METRA|nr:Phosphatidylinositol N-acetylglucosaminyltransferase [Metarhizium robertsii ARSEF 23]EFZ03743.1 Phosphatidylinositol N-acetylglucosaminyltransferase [Metarhizium robertsii ARSEF 23]